MCGCVRELISRFKTFFLFAGLFSLAINALLLVPRIYMLQVFDRVLTSRSEESLVYLTLGGATALVVVGVRAAALAVLVLASVEGRVARRRAEGAEGRAGRAGRYLDGGVRDVGVVAALGMLPAVAKRWGQASDGALREQLGAARVG